MMMLTQCWMVYWVVSRIHRLLHNVVYRPLVLPQFRSYYSVGRAGRRWWKYIFWGLLNIGIIINNYNYIITYRCCQCNKVLVEQEYVAEDNSDASIGCECHCGCDNWSCWSCGEFTSEMDKAEVKWVYPMCTADCTSNLDYKAHCRERTFSSKKISPSVEHPWHT